MLANSSKRAIRYAMKLAYIAIVGTLLATQTALAHPHSGGIVTQRDGTVIVGDILGLRLLQIDSGGTLREVPGVGDVRGLTTSSEGTVFGVSWQRGAGIWRLSAEGRPTFVLEGFEGLTAAADRGSFLLAPINEHGLAQSVEILRSNGERSKLASVTDISAIAWHQGTTYIAAGSTIYAIEAAGTVKTLAANIGTGLYCMVMGPNGLIVACYDQRQVVEIAPNGARRALLTSDSSAQPDGLRVLEGE